MEGFDDLVIDCNFIVHILKSESNKKQLGKFFFLVSEKKNEKKNPLLQISESFVNSSLFFIFFFLLLGRRIFSGVLIRSGTWWLYNLGRFQTLSPSRTSIWKFIIMYWKKLGLIIYAYIYSIWFVSLQISLHSLNLES